MDVLKQYVTGDLEPAELRGYLVFETLVFWGLIFVCWLIYPVENKYSIMTHTFSFLGSFEGQHNPRGWWLFTVAMIFWGLATVPLTFYLYRRFAASSPWGARVGALLMLAGCAGVVLVGIFPDARNPIIGDWRSTDIHEKAALLIAAGLGLSIPWHGLLVLKDRFSWIPFGGEGCFDCRRLAWPYLFWLTITGVAVYFQVKWEFVYAEMRAAAEASGTKIGSHWSEALNTPYSFPLWENVVIYTLFLTLIWLAIAVSNE